MRLSRLRLNPRKLDVCCGEEGFMGALEFTCVSFVIYLPLIFTCVNSFRWIDQDYADEIFRLVLTFNRQRMVVFRFVNFNCFYEFIIIKVLTTNCF